MKKALTIFLIILSIPVFLVFFVVVHEVGHTILARLLGDPDSIFYLAKIDENNFCLGCNIYDPLKLSWGGNLIVSLGGLLATQAVALFTLLLLRLRRGNDLSRSLLSTFALAFAFLDVPLQVLQGLVYNLNSNTWPTNVDLMDFMLLVQGRIEGSQLLLKGILLTVAVIYLSGFLWAYKQNRKDFKPA